MKIATTVIALIAALNVAFAGCLVPQDEGKTASATESSAPATDAGNETAATNETADGAPVLVVEISDNGTALAIIDGVVNASAGVNLTFDAQNSTDPDGDNLTFSWDFGDNGTADTPNATHAYAAAGNFTLNVTVSDDAGGSANASYTIVVASGASAAGVFIRDETTRFTGSVTQPIAEAFCGDSPAGFDHVSFDWVITASEPDGTATAVSRFYLVLTMGATSVDSDWYFYDPSGAELGSSHGFEPTDGDELPIEVVGMFAPGTYKILVNTCAALAASVTVDATATYVTA